MNKEKLIKTLKTDTDLWNRYRRCFSYEVSTLIDLREADLSKVDLSRVNPCRVDLSSANLSSANLIVEETRS